MFYAFRTFHAIYFPDLQKVKVRIAKDSHFPWDKLFLEIFLIASPKTPQMDHVFPPQALPEVQVMSPGLGQLEMGDTEDCNHLDSK